MKQKILFFFLFLFALQIIMPVAIFADTGKPIDFNPEVLIPGMKTNSSGGAETIKIDAGGNAVRSYVSNFYKFGIGLTGILATIMFAVGGLIWLTSGGSTTQIGKAKQCILGSLTGLVLALSSYVILSSINPSIVNLHWGKSISALGNIGVGCSWVDRKCNEDYEKDSPGSCGVRPKADEYYCCCIIASASCSDFSEEKCKEEDYKCIWDLTSMKCRIRDKSTGTACFSNQDSYCNEGSVCNMFFKCAGDNEIGGCCNTPGVGGEKCRENNDCEDGYSCLNYACNNDTTDDKCQECGQGFWNACDKEECDSLGDSCVYSIRGSLFGTCSSQ